MKPLNTITMNYEIIEVERAVNAAILGYREGYIDGEPTSRDSLSKLNHWAYKIGYDRGVADFCYEQGPDDSEYALRSSNK